MADLGKLALAITADPSGFNSGLKSAGDRLQNFGATASGAMNNVKAAAAAMWASPLGAAVMIGGAIAGVGAALVKSAEDHIKHASAQAGMARMFGVSMDAAAGLQHQMESTNMSTEDMNGALRFFFVRVRQAASGQGEAADAFRRWNLDAERMQQMRPEEALRVYADATLTAGDASSRLAMIHDTLSRRGMALEPVIRRGSHGMRDAVQQAQELGRAYGEAGKSMAESKRVWEASGSVWNEAMGKATGWFANIFAKARGGAGLLFTAMFGSERDLQRVVNIAYGLNNRPLGGTQPVDPRVSKALEDAINGIRGAIESAIPAAQRWRRERDWLVEIGTDAEGLAKFDRKLEELQRTTARGLQWSLYFNVEELALQAAGAVRGAEELRVKMMQLQGQLKAGQDADLALWWAKTADSMRTVVALIKQAETPGQVLGTQIEQINQAFRAGQITAGAYMTAMTQAYTAFDRTTQSRGLNLASNITAGSSQAISVINANAATPSQSSAPERAAVELVNIRELMRQAAVERERMGRAMEDLAFGGPLWRGAAPAMP